MMGSVDPAGAWGWTPVMIDRGISIDTPSTLSTGPADLRVRLSQS